MHLSYLNKKETWELELDLWAEITSWSLPFGVYWTSMKLNTDFEPGYYRYMGFRFLCFGILVGIWRWYK